MEDSFPENRESSLELILLGEEGLRRDTHPAGPRIRNLRRRAADCRDMPEITEIRLPTLAALMFALVMTACAGALSSAEDSLAPLPGETLPAEAAYRFTLPSGLDGEVSLETYAGEQNVVLVFYRGFW